MKVACVLLLCLGLFSTSQAVTLDDLKEVGKDAVNKVVDQVKDAVSDAANDFLQKVLGGLSTLGKRDLSKITDLMQDLGEKLGDLTDKGKKMAIAVFSDTVDKLQALVQKTQETIGSITDASGIASKIDSLVAQHHSRQKRVIDTLVQTGQRLISGAVDKVKDAASMLKKGASAVVSGLLQKGVDLLGKRGLTDQLQAIGNALSPLVQPIQDALGDAGETLKGHFSNLVDTVQGHATALKTKLDPHISDLKDHGQKLAEHGKNALGALSEVVGDILNQTVQNAGESLSGIADTAGKMGGVVVDHFTGDDTPPQP